MNYIIIENSLRAFTFFSLLVSMLFYWIKTAFFSSNKDQKFEFLLLFVCNLLLSSLLIIRWMDSHHFPLSNLYESLIFLCWSLNCFLIYLQIKIKENYVGVLITPLILFLNTFATFSLPKEMQKASSLVPALQSNWLMMHVTIMMLSYAALIFGSLLAIAFLIVKKFSGFQKINFSISNFSNQPISSLSEISIPSDNQSFKKSFVELKQNVPDSYLIDKLDNISYRTLGIGFPLLTIGILSGAVWANETWGSYWSWDPKETWALITWFIYAIYLHSRIIKGWIGEKPALIASFGFLAVWVCYLGVNILGKGLHSYGWIEFS